MSPRTPKNAENKLQVNTWEAELVKSAAVATKAEARQLDRPFISMGNGQMSLGGARFPNDEAPVIVLSDIHANLYYDGPYDPNNPTPPTCYAYGRSDEAGDLIGVDTWDGRGELAPHKDCSARQHTDCASCPLNQFGSGQGKGKACQNTRRLGLIPAGTFINGRFEAFSKPEQIADASPVYLKLPVMSVKGFAAFVVQVAGALQRPLWGVFSKLKRVPDKSQYVATWEALGTIPNALMEAVFAKHKEVAKDISFPFAPKPDAPVLPLNTRKPLKRKYS